MSTYNDLAAVASAFEICGEFVSAEPFGSGHINDTFRVVFIDSGRRFRYILQRVNNRVFKHPAALMGNIERVTSHLFAQTADLPDRQRRVLTLIRTRDNSAFHVDGEGRVWRVYRYVENSQAFDAVETPDQAYEAGRAFGQFQQLLAGLPADQLQDTIPDFHHTPKRFAALEQAIAADVAGRAASAKKEIAFALAHRSITGVLLDAQLPLRVTHNDAKFNNVLLDEKTGEAICVIDLDTVMPGLAPYDFGDMVRTTTSPTQEDERDLSKVTLQFHIFEALTRGYLRSANGFLTNAEKQLLVFSGKLITFEIGVRFLTDHLCGDTYFKVHRSEHNLDRCRTQFKLVESIEQQQDELERLVQSIG
jgi:Ser/Thr protein kinase RdoA (MazF antagonist)